MFCFKCGSLQADDARFCGVCGTGLAGVSGQQAGAPMPVASSVSSPPANPAPEARAADAHLTVEEWAVACTPPDDDGDVRFEAKVRGEFHGATAAHVARLSWVAFDASGSIPLFQADNTLTQDIDDEDSVEVEAGGYGKLGEGVEPGACRIGGQVVLFPGEKQAPWTIPLPEADQAGGEGPAWPIGGAGIAGWRLTSSDSSDDSASYTLCLVVRNFGAQALAAVTFRVRVKNRKGDVWSTEHVLVERLASGETRSVETNLYVSERAKARKGATIELVGVVCRFALVHALASTVAVLKVEDAAGDDDGAGGTVDETEDEEPDAYGRDGDGDAGDSPLMVNGGWEEKRKAKAICRWFVAWKTVEPGAIAGAVAGYSGGGAFQVERFYAKTRKAAVTSLWIDGTDRITGDEIDFDTAGNEAVVVCEAALDAIWEWNDNAEWGESDEVVLIPERRDELSAEGDMLYLARETAPFLRTICEKAGLTAAPGHTAPTVGERLGSEDDDPGASDDDGDETTEDVEGDEAPSDEDGPEVPVVHVEPSFISYQVNDETVLEASDDFESTATDFESEVLRRINSSGEVGRFRKHMVSLAHMVVKGSYRANWVTCESEDSRIDLIFRPGYVTCVVHKYVVESD